MFRASTSNLVVSPAVVTLGAAKEQLHGLSSDQHGLEETGLCVEALKTVVPLELKNLESKPLDIDSHRFAARWDLGKLRGQCQPTRPFQR